MASSSKDRNGSAEQAEREYGTGELPVHSLTAELLHRVDGSSRGEASKHEGQPVEGMRFLCAHVVDPQERENERKNAEGEIKEENPVPACVCGDEASEWRTDDQRCQARPRDIRNGLGELVFRSRA